MYRSEPEKDLKTARHLLRCVMLEQRAAIEELTASNRELRSILDPSAADDRTEAADQASSNLPEDASITHLKQEADRLLEQARAAISESARLRERSEAARAGLPKEVEVPKALSKRERQVLHLIVAGKSSKQIAAELGISFKTAVTHRASIMGKLDVHEIASVVREAIRRGLV
jgi:DNA-binding NarL/FixJ family response regulator